MFRALHRVCSKIIANTPTSHWAPALGTSMIIIGTLALTLNTAYLWGYARHAVYITQTTKLYATLAIVDLMSSLTIVPIHAS